MTALTEIPGVSRDKAMKLFDAGFKTCESVAWANASKLPDGVGPQAIENAQSALPEWYANTIMQFTRSAKAWCPECGKKFQATNLRTALNGLETHEWDCSGVADARERQFGDE